MSESMSVPERAMQIWQILIGAAHNRQTLTYGQLADYLEFDGAGVLSQMLDPIMRLCESNGWPPLTCLVVNQETGVPGSGLSTVENLPQDREAVYEKKWYALALLQTIDFNISDE